MLIIILKYSYLSSQQNRFGSSGSATYFSSSLTTKSWISFIRFSCFNSALSGVGDRSLFRFSFSAIILASRSFLSLRKCFPLFSWNRKTEIYEMFAVQKTLIFLKLWLSVHRNEKVSLVFDFLTCRNNQNSWNHSSKRM